MNRRILEITDAERDWIASNLAAAREMVVGYGLPSEIGVHLGPAILDESWTRWLATHDRGSDDPNPLINAFGIAFGTYLHERLGLEWRIVEDDNGTDMALWGRDGDVLVYPANLVAKRYASGDPTFFVAAAAAMEEEVHRLRSGSARTGATGLGRFLRRGR